MTNRGWLIFCVGAAMLGVGLLALNFPVFIGAWDKYGWQIKCGTGYSTDLMQADIATQAAPQTNLVDECQTALAVRRTWAGAMALIGWVLLSGVAVALWRHASAHHHHESEPEPERRRLTPRLCHREAVVGDDACQAVVVDDESGE